jgi:hypothetical protein
MDTVDALMQFVNEQVDFHRRQATRFAGERRRAANHTSTADKFDKLLIFLIDIKVRLDENPNLFEAASAKKAPRLALSWEEVEGLPPELMEELSISESDKTEFEITGLITELGGVASLDRIIVALYRKSKEISKRGVLNQRLYRMVQKEMIFSVPGKKGVYSTRSLSEEEAAQLV